VTRTMNKDDLKNSTSPVLWWNEETLKGASVMVLGAGALGNEVLKNLALLGIGKIFLVDFDTITKSNLSRSVLFREKNNGKSKVDVAAGRVKEINPQVKVRPFHGNILYELGLGVYRRMDVVIGCLDNGEARLAVNRCCWKTNTPWIDGGLLELAGIVKVFMPPYSACYECGMSELDYKLINVRYSCDLLAQDRQIEGATPTTPTIASIIGAIQAQEAVKLLHGMETTEGKGITYNGMSNEYFITRYPRKEDCLSHEYYEDVIELDVGAEELTAKGLLQIASGYLGEGTVIELGYEIIESIICPTCGMSKNITQPAYKLTSDRLKCFNCGGQCIPEMTHKITGNEAFSELTLYELGIPLLDIIAAKNNGRYIYLELTKDVCKMMKYA
jgi:molybdopterin/thiamine biosynthesis adenylyltransferase